MRDHAVESRDEVAAQMTPAQIAEAQRLSRLCLQRDFMGCDETGVALPTRQTILLERHNGTYVIPVVINGVITLEFTIDSGASDVSIPSDVVSTLVRTGTVSSGDFLGNRTFVLADGSKIPSETFKIRSLKVGDVLLQDVLGSVARPKGGLLLGQSFLGRLKSWSVDNQRHVLTIE